MVSARYGSGITIHVNIDAKQLARLERDLAHVKNAAPRVLYRSINRTLTTVRANVAREIKAEIPKLKIGEIKSKLHTRKASLRKTEGRLSMSGRRYTLARFAYKQTRRGVPFMVYKSEGRLLAPRAFIIEGSSRFKPPFIRATDAGHKGLRRIDIRTGRLEGEGGDLVPRGPLDIIIGPELADVFKDKPGMVARIEQHIDATFTKNLNAYAEHELDKALARV
jgi:hypothetical protein